MKYFSKLVYFFLTIGSNTERRKQKVDYGNLAMIVFYFIQLLGYLYSQFESKTQVFYENDYLAQIGQYSSIPFMMIVIHYDPFTTLVYYCIFGTMCSIYGIIIFQILFKPLPPSNLINRFVKFYFQNFQWYFLTPFHETMIGVLTCGRLAYLEQHAGLNPRNCFAEISPHFLVISFLGQALVIISGFLSLYCFRNYEFIQGDLMRKFSYLNFLTILLHMILQMASFWKEMYDNYNIIIHVIFIMIMFIISLDTFSNFPFGFSSETIHFSQCLLSATFFEILVAIWIFSDLDDGHIFLTFCIVVPLIFGINQAFYDNYIDNQCQQFVRSRCKTISEHPLEVICQLCHQDIKQQHDYFLVLKYLEIHCQNCCDLICPCKQKINKFIHNHNQLSTNQIYLWVQYEFQQMIKSILQNTELFKQFEQLTIKFVTFLQKYRENQVLSYKIIQDVIQTFKKINSDKKPFFFLNLAKHIQYQNKVEMENINKAGSQISQSEYLTLQEFNLFYRYEQSLVSNLNGLLVTQKQLWIEKLRNQIQLEKILSCSNDIMKRTLILKKIIKKFENSKESPKIDTILTLRIKLVSSLVCMEDINLSMKIARHIQSYEKDLINQKQLNFNSLQFIQGQALSVISNISTQTFGQISQQINDQFYNFFGYENNNGATLTKIEQLLPNKIGKIHNGLIESFLQKGKSSRLYQNSDQFIINSDNLIEKVSICLTTLFPYQNEQYQFLMIGHILKRMKYEKREIDYNKRGYILVDQNFLVFGLTRNVYERINYKYFYKNEKDLELIMPQEIYDEYSIQTLIPQLSLILEEYYKLLALRNEKKILKHDIICQREIGVFQCPSTKIQNVKTSSTLLTKKNTNKHMMNILKDANFSLANIPTFSQKQYPIEYSVTQKVLDYVENDAINEFLYFIIELDFLEDPKLNATPSQVIARSPALSDLLRYQQIQVEQIRPNQSNIILSNDDNNDQIELMAELTNTGTRRSSNEIIDQLEKIIIYINDTLLPKSIKDLIAQFLIQILVFATIIIVLSSLFKHKRSIQSDCIEQITYDLNFLDAYSQAMAGSRHVIYYRDFYSIQNNSLIYLNLNQINFSRYDKIYVAWQHISKGNIRLNKMYENYTKRAQKSQIKLLTIYFVNFDLKSKIQQEVQDYSTYYQIMHQTFYLQYQSFSSSPQNYLSGNDDSYITQLARSQVYYNFFDVIESANFTLQDCQSYNLQINDYFDTIIIFYFLGMYIILILVLISIIIHYYRVVKSIKIYIKLFKMCDKEDCQHIIHLCESLISMVNYDKIFLRQQDFKVIMAQPRHTLENVKKSQSKTTIILIRKKSNNQRSIKNNQNNLSFYSIIMLILISIGLITYILSFHLYYIHIKNSITPISNQAILAQESRLNFIASVNRFDLYFIKLYYETYSRLNQVNENYQFTSKNIQTDTQILQLLTINIETLILDLKRLKAINFVDLIFHNDQANSQLDSNQQDQILKNDVCIFTGCNMQTELLFDRLFKNELMPLFYTGVLNLHTKILSFIQDAFQVVQQDLSDVEIIMNLEHIFNDSDYLIYMHWGLDIIQFQIQEFSQYFLNISQQTINSLTQNNQLLIISIGTLLLILISIFSIMFINIQYQRYVQSKAIIKCIPLPILFQKNIPKHLENFRRKYEQ
ncbi:unnamed protein product [Paramecium pentaurelia]|uniref:Transmembrane protein n=1 Tax=Paramecium pentaurelia TaxID=43138 RepID=A0A8S1UE39_9CILI|nr:unnamed protein product [Paramecium pentaurelia]